MGQDCNYNLQGNNFLNRRRVNSVRHGTETVHFLSPKTWDVLPKEVKSSEMLNAFKGKIKTEFLRNALVDFAKHIYLK